MQADVYVLRPAIALAGRLMFTLIFFLSGITHFTSLDDYVRLMPEATPESDLRVKSYDHLNFSRSSVVQL